MNTGWKLLSNINNVGKEVCVGFDSFVIIEVNKNYIVGEYPSGNQLIYYKNKHSQYTSGASCQMERIYDNEEIAISEKPVFVRSKETEDLDVVTSEFVKKLRELSKDNIVAFEMFVNFESYEIKNTIHTSQPTKSMRNLAGEFVK